MKDALSNGMHREKPRTSRHALPLSLVVATGCALLMAAGAQAAPVTVGSPLTGTFTSTMANQPGTASNSSLPEAGANVTSPINGTVVRWRITQATGGPFKLRVLTPDGGTTYTGAGSSALETPSSTATQTFATNLPIQGGQTIGIDNALGSDHLGIASVPGASLIAWVPPLADGQTRAASTSGPNAEIGFNADVQPFPSISSISPSSGSTSGGTTVTISGQNFLGTTSVSFGTTPAASFTVLSDTVMTAVAPAESAGTVDIVVKNPGQSPLVAGDHFTFTTPVAPAKCVVPKLKGSKLKKAKQALAKANCTLGKVTKKKHKKGKKHKARKVKSQSPALGTVLPPGSKVSVKLS